ncbi:MAG: hypothetical protein JWN38_301 [Candidatus Saccharibacteria bacterium]|nr:hypothetical protein [Candidatus Saccharibacteria bacterium]
MPAKQFTLSDNQTVIDVVKRSSSRHLRLSIKSDGRVLVSIPKWSSFRSAVAFAESRLGWIKQQVVPSGFLRNGQPIGKSHTLQFVERGPNVKLGSRLINNKIIVNYPSSLTINSPVVQAVAEAAAERALRKQANDRLPPRLAVLAAAHDFSYKSVQIKRLKSRWGSCDQNQNIVLNLFLMQLDDPLIDYVLLHELAHTEHLNHSDQFWARVAETVPHYKLVRKQVHAHKPVVEKAAGIL